MSVVKLVPSDNASSQLSKRSAKTEMQGLRAPFEKLLACAQHLWIPVLTGQGRGSIPVYLWR